MTKDELLEQVCELVRQVTAVRFEGAAYAKLSRVHGYADGYMRALLDAGLVERDMLLKAVSKARLEVINKDADARAAA